MAALAGVATLTSLTAHSQGGVKNLVFLQPNTPGVAQSGHANVSGVVRANQFVGGGAGLNNLDANSITSGTLAAARLPVGVAFLTATQSWSGTNFFSGNTTFAAPGAPFAVGNSNLVTNLNADLLDGLSSSAFLQSIPVPLNLSGTNVGGSIVSAANAATLVGSRGVSGFVTGATGDTSGVHGQNTSSSGKGVSGIALSGTGVTYGLHGTSNSTSGIGAYGVATATSGSTRGVYARTESPSGIGLLAESVSSAGGYAIRTVSAAPSNSFGTITGINSYSGSLVARAGYFESSGGAETVQIRNLAPSGGTEALNVRADSQDGIGVLAYGATALSGIVTSDYTTGTALVASNLTGSGRAIDAFISSATGFGIDVLNGATSGDAIAGQFISNSDNGISVFGIVDSTLGTGSGIGGYFRTDGDTGRGVFGENTSTNGLGFGVYGQSESSIGRGVLGNATATGALDTPYGVRGTASTATLGFAVFAAGDMGASGVKPFRIDHPLDPENMYLLHYSAESPFPQNFYNGSVVTDAKGYAWIELPNYFGEINTNFKYQLTVVDEEDSEDFVLAKVTRKIKANRFQIRTSKPNVEVSWEVKADRNDLRIRANRPTDERPKVGLEKGKYQHPEYYGAPKSSGMDYVAPRTKPVRSQSKR